MQMHPLTPVADKYCGIECYRTRGRLSDSEQIQKVLTLNPAAFIYNLALNKRHHSITATKGKGSDFEEGYK